MYKQVRPEQNFCCHIPVLIRVCFWAKTKNFRSLLQIQWFKNDLLYTPLNNHIQSELRIDNTSLVSNSLSKLDSGRYACSARNAGKLQFALIESMSST